MLPDVGATELMIIAAVALIVVGPKDLPMLMRKVGQFMARMRGMASEFRASFDEMARQSELDELRKEVQALRSGNYMDDTKAALSAHTAEVEDVFYDIDRDLNHSPDPELSTDPWSAPPEEPAPAEPKPKRAPRAKAVAAEGETPEPAKRKSRAKPKPVPGAEA